MKKLIGLVATVFCTGIIYANGIKDSVPEPVMNGNNPPTMATPDTIPEVSLRPDTTRQTQWNKDSVPTGINNPEANREWSNKDSAAISTEKKAAESGEKVREDRMGNKESRVDAKENKTDKSADDNTETVKAKKPLSDRVMMKDGEMHIVKNGVESKMTKNITLEDGSVVNSDGTVKMPDGNSVKLKDGEHIKITKATKAAKAVKKGVKKG